MTKSIKIVCDPSTNDPYPQYVLRPATNPDEGLAVWDGVNTGKLKTGTKVTTGSTIGTGSQQTIAHGLGVCPKVISFQKEIGATITVADPGDVGGDPDGGATNFYPTITTGKWARWIAES